MATHACVEKVMGCTRAVSQTEIYQHNDMASHEFASCVSAPRAEALEDAASNPFDSEDSASECSDTSCEDDCSPAPQDTQLIFDWDDTILPSTWLHEQCLTLRNDSWPTEEQQARLDSLAESVARTLRVAKKLGRVTLVTNAQDGWIELSCQKFMPSLWPTLEDLKLFSARSTYEHQGVESPCEWKCLAFALEINSFYQACDKDHQKNIISVGDSTHEREALMRVTEPMCNCHVKSLKLVECPEVDQLLKEHQLLADCMRSIVSHDGNLDLRLRSS